MNFSAYTGGLFDNTVQASKQVLNKEIYSLSPEDKYYKSTMQLSYEVNPVSLSWCMKKMSLKLNSGEAKCSLVEGTLVYTSMGEFGGKKKKMSTYNLTLLTPVCRMRVRKADEGILFYEHINQNIRNYSSSWAMWKKSWKIG